MTAPTATGRAPATGPGRAVDALADWLRRHRVVVDVVVALVVLQPSMTFGGAGPVAGLVLGAVACAALVGRRIRPLASAGVVALCGIVAATASIPPAAIALPVLVSVYSLTAWGPRWAGLPGAGLAVAGAGLWVGPSAADGLDTPWESVLGTTAVLCLTAWLAGMLRRAGRRNLDHLRERARLVETEQEQRERLAVLGERERIAREMHDIVAHSLSVIVVQADGGRVAATHDAFTGPETAASVFADIAGTGRSALADIRAVLGLLHGTSPEDDAQDAPPKPGVDAVPVLAEEFERAGATVALAATGDRRTLPAGLGLTTYRVVQESLTNAVKHAGPTTHASVELAWFGDHLDVRVTDQGPVPGAPAPQAGAAGSLGGHGLRGMRERVEAHGGDLTAGPSGRGWAVHARLPFPDDMP